MRAPVWGEGQSGAQGGNKGYLGSAESIAAMSPSCQLWRKTEALVETELANRAAGRLSRKRGRSRGPEKIRNGCKAARYLSV